LFFLFPGMKIHKCFYHETKIYSKIQEMALDLKFSKKKTLRIMCEIIKMTYDDLKSFKKAKEHCFYFQVQNYITSITTK
jgi:hypothetical protein